MTRKSAGIIRAFPPEAGSEKDSPELPVCIHCVAVGRFERNLMTRFISELAGTLVPYVPGEQPKDKKYVKLNTNENPYPPSPAVLRAIRKETENLRLYPDPDADAAREAAAAYYNESLSLDGDAALDRGNFFIGNGSDEILAFIYPTFFKGKKLAFPDITYSFYPVYAALFEVDCEIFPLKEDFSMDLETLMPLPEDVAGLLLCNPNAPTGRALELAEIRRILEANRERLIVVDEAYVDFGAETAAGLVNEYDNLLITQTLSKSRQLAGIRSGLAIGCHELIQALDTVKNSFNSYTADRLAIAATVAAFEDRDYFHSTRNTIIETRDHVTAELRRMDFDVIESSANFIFVKPPAMIRAEQLFTELRNRGVLVRYFNKPRISDRLRVTIGTPEQMKTFLATVREILEECS